MTFSWSLILLLDPRFSATVQGERRGVFEVHQQQTLFLVASLSDSIHSARTWQGLAFADPAVSHYNYSETPDSFRLCAAFGCFPGLCVPTCNCNQRIGSGYTRFLKFIKTVLREKNLNVSDLSHRNQQKRPNH